MKMSFHKRLLLSTALGSLLVCAVGVSGPSLAATGAEWNPAASERLVKLPANHMKKAIDRDFAASPLAAAIRTHGESLAAKKQTLQELQEASEIAEGDARIELKHQFLAEKQSFVRLLGERIEFQRQEVQTRLRLYNRLLEKFEREGRGQSEQTKALIEQQRSTRARLEEVTQNVDLSMFGTGAEQSKYAKAYEENRAAIEKLVQAINNHPMNRLPELDGEPIERTAYLRRLVEDSEATIAILDQEEEILGYMGKLVALDAMALHEEVADIAAANNPHGESADVSVSSTADLFVQ